MGVCMYVCICVMHISKYYVFIYVYCNVYTKTKFKKHVGMEKLFKICELVLPDFDNFFFKSSLKANI